MIATVSLIGRGAVPRSDSLFDRRGVLLGTAPQAPLPEPGTPKSRPRGRRPVGERLEHHGSPIVISGPDPERKQTISSQICPRRTSPSPGWAGAGTVGNGCDLAFCP